jgi:hypothetical protein
MSPRKKMVIISSYFSGETYGLLGPQTAATVITENTPYTCVVITVTREDDRQQLKNALVGYFGPERPVIGFSTLSGREDLFEIARQVRKEGAVTILAGPQAGVDYLGEVGWRQHHHRFKGLGSHFTLSLQGPAEQSVRLLQNLNGLESRNIPGLLLLAGNDRVIQNDPQVWDENFLNKIRWDNIFRLRGKRLGPRKIYTGQVLQQIGCPYAKKGRRVEIDFPAHLQKGKAQRTKLLARGCSFCDVAVDKGYHGRMSMAAVVSQINCLPEREDGRKIPFELINENPMPDLPLLLNAAREHKIRLSQINLTMRADWLLKGAEHLRAALKLAEKMDVKILMASVGFESFDDTILRNLNKGINVQDNLRAVFLMRRLKEEFSRVWRYKREEGANHGFIHPTPWDTDQTGAMIQRRINRYSLSNDILPEHSTPLIIHHASALGDWIREVEARNKIRFKRYGSIIGWWPEAIY